MKNELLGNSKIRKVSYSPSKKYQISGIFPLVKYPNLGIEHVFKETLG
jgi:hypothetical protein